MSVVDAATPRFVEDYAELNRRERERSDGVVPAELDEGFAGADATTKRLIEAEVRRRRPELEAVARSLYEAPELGFAEHATVALLTAHLRGSGFEVTQPAFGLDTAFSVTVGEGGPHFAVLAEYDALPGIGHACGHNVIAAWSLGTFYGLAAVADRLGGRVSLIGTPAEEGGGGKELILRAGGFDDVDAAGILHPGGGTGVSSVFGNGTSGIRSFDVVYRGRATHAAVSPYLGVNALDAAVSAYQGLAQLRQHIHPSESVQAIIREGGDAANVIPERAALSVYVRSFEMPTLANLTSRVEAVLRGAGAIAGAEVEIVESRPPYLPLRNNITLTRRWALATEALGAPVAVGRPGARVAGPSSDTGNVSQFIPTLHPSIGLGSPNGIGPHNPLFADFTVTPASFDRLVLGAASLAGAAADFLADADLRQAVEDEFARTGGRTHLVDRARVGNTA
jgi:amidohydrolase